MDEAPAEPPPNGVLITLIIFAFISVCAVYSLVIEKNAPYGDPSVGVVLLIIDATRLVLVYSPVALALLYAYRRSNKARIFLVLFLFIDILAWAYATAAPVHEAAAPHYGALALHWAELACAALLLSPRIGNWYQPKSSAK